MEAQSGRGSWAGTVSLPGQHRAFLTPPALGSSRCPDDRPGLESSFGRFSKSLPAAAVSDLRPLLCHNVHSSALNTGIHGTLGGRASEVLSSVLTEPSGDEGLSVSLLYLCEGGHGQAPRMAQCPRRSHCPPTASHCQMTVPPPLCMWLRAVSLAQEPSPADLPCSSVACQGPGGKVPRARRHGGSFLRESLALPGALGQER